MSYRMQRPERAGPVLLMCPPDYYSVEYEINPWMDRRRSVDKAKAWAQWNALYRTLLEKVGAAIELAPPALRLPDFVFTANAGMVTGDTFIPSHFRYPERAREEPHWRAWFEARGYRVLDLSADVHFEGEGDVLPCDNLLVGGYRFRSDREALCRVGQLMKRELLALELADPWFYHLDTCFCPLGEGAVLYFPQAFTEAGRQAIRGRFPDALAVPEEEARRFVCNSVVIGQHVVMSCNCPWTQAELRSRGYRVHKVDVSEFLKAGGGAKCLALFLARATAIVPSGEAAAAQVGASPRSSE